MQTIESPDLLKVTEGAGSGIRSLQLSRMAIGMVPRGEKIIYYNDHSTTIGAGEVYLDEAGTTETTLEETIVLAKGHKETTLAAVAPTCTETGLTAGKKCSVCQTVTVAQETVDALGHTEEDLAAVAPTCTETGLTAGKKCSVKLHVPGHVTVTVVPSILAGR